MCWGRFWFAFNGMCRDGGVVEAPVCLAVHAGSGVPRPVGVGVGVGVANTAAMSALLLLCHPLGGSQHCLAAGCDVTVEPRAVFLLSCCLLQDAHSLASVSVNSCRQQVSLDSVAAAAAALAARLQYSCGGGALLVSHQLSWCWLYDMTVDCTVDDLPL